VVLVWLDKIEVGSFALREAVLTVKLELSGDNWVLTPAVHVEGSLSKNENTGIGKTVADAACESSTKGTVRNSRSGRSVGSGTAREWVRCGRSTGGLIDGNTTRDIEWKSVVEKTGSVDDIVVTATLVGRSECEDGIRKSIDGIRVVERLSTECLVH
jgi:hypothetical protein